MLSLPADRQPAPESAGPSPGGVRRSASGRLDLEFHSDPDGRTYLHRQFANHPFHICRAQYHDSDRPGLATLYLQSCSGGLYEDDRLDIRLVAGEGAEAHVSTQSATVVHSMPRGSAEQRAAIESRTASYIEYLPDPQILFPGSRCRSSIDVKLAPGAVALVSDAFLAHDPAGAGATFSAYMSRISISDSSGALLSVDRLEIEGGRFQVSQPGTFGQYGAQGSMVIASADVLPQSLAIELGGLSFPTADSVSGVSLLPKSAGMIVRVLARDGAALKQAMHLVWCAARVAIKGAPPHERRK